MWKKLKNHLFGQPENDARAQEGGDASSPAGGPRRSFFTTDIENDDLLTRDQRIALLSAKAFPKTIGDTFVVSGAGEKATTFAMDSSNSYGESIKSVFALNQVGIPDAQAGWYASQGFIGYQMCALIAQHWLVQKACSIPARDAVRKGYELTVNDGTPIRPDVMAAIVRANKKYKLNKHLTEFVRFGRVFGIRIAIFKVDSRDKEYYVKPFNHDSVTPGSYKGISQIDPYWCVPELDISAASDPSAMDFYEPTYWVINGKRVHKSHLVIFRGPDVADILKPSYLYGGLSIPQLVYERVYGSERTANEAPQLALTKRAIIFYTDAAKALAQQDKFEERLNIWAHFRDNYGIKMADADGDKIEQHDTSLSDLDSVIMTQYQLVAAVVNIPATKLLGTTPKGFNATGDYEAASYREELESIQINDLEPLIERHMTCLIRSEICPKFNIEPFAVDCTWEPLDSPTHEQAAAVRKMNAETYKILSVDIGAVDATEVRDRLAADKDSGFSGLETLSNEDENGEPDAEPV